MNKDWTRDVTCDQLPEAHRKFADALGLEAAMRLFQTFGGEIMYIPMLDSVWSVVRRERIKEEYVNRGTKIKHLAKKYGITPQEVHRILRGEKPEQMTIEGLERAANL